MPKLKITDIKVGKRSRKNLGDIAELAASMDDIGLLHPVVVTAEHKLVAGYRRIRAAKSLKWPDIEVRVVRNLSEALAALHSERDENTCRKDFEPSEAVAMGERLRPLEEAEAKKRQKAAGVDKKSTKA